MSKVGYIDVLWPWVRAGDVEAEERDGEVMKWLTKLQRASGPYAWKYRSVAEAGIVSFRDPEDACAFMLIAPGASIHNG